MPIYFRNTPASEPFIFDSVGNHWEQDQMNRPKGYPKYHYLQTEKGSGIIDIQGKQYTLNENEGLLIAPFVPHFYYNLGTNWKTTFITFTGTIRSYDTGNTFIKFKYNSIGKGLKSIYLNTL